MHRALAVDPAFLCHCSAIAFEIRLLWVKKDGQALTLEAWAAQGVAEDKHLLYTCYMAYALARLRRLRVQTDQAEARAREAHVCHQL